MYIFMLFPYVVACNVKVIDAYTQIRRCVLKFYQIDKISKMRLRAGVCMLESYQLDIFFNNRPDNMK